MTYLEGWLLIGWSSLYQEIGTLVLLVAHSNVTSVGSRLVMTSSRVRSNVTLSSVVVVIVVFFVVVIVVFVVVIVVFVVVVVVVVVVIVDVECV